MKHALLVYVIHDTSTPSLRNRRKNVDSICGLFPWASVVDGFASGFHPYFQHCSVSKERLSLLLKHQYCWWSAMANRGYNWSLILEDDCLLPANIHLLISYAIDELNDCNAEMCFVGSDPQRHWPELIPGKYVYGGDGKTFSRESHAYLINGLSALKLISSPLTYVYDRPIDHKLDQVIAAQGIKNYWLEPGIEQSKEFTSSITPP